MVIKLSLLKVFTLFFPSCYTVSQTTADGHIWSTFIIVLDFVDNFLWLTLKEIVFEYVFP